MQAGARNVGVASIGSSSGCKSVKNVLFFLGEGNGGQIGKGEDSVKRHSQRFCLSKSVTIMTPRFNSDLLVVIV